MKNNQGSEDLKENLSEYIPQAFVPYVHDLLCSTKVLFRIVPPRKTKLGDFRKPLNGKSIPQITVNNNLNPYAFLITTLHEIAHLHTYLRYGHSVKPHGKEWKYEFQQVLLPLISAQKFPETLKLCLKNTITNTKASSFSDIPLNRALREFDRDKKGCHLEKIELGKHFTLNKKMFKKGKLRRTRYLCTEVSSGKAYLIHALAEVNYM
tara:strand:+ start:1658 stop:2281 length:624 start_codon:yes stop_codon:yes gene_type:complete